MRAITAHSTMASWLAGRRSWSRTQRRCVLIQAKVRSTTQRRGRTWKVCRRAAYDDDNIEHHSRLLVVQTPAVRAIITQGRRLAHLNRAAHYGRCGLIVSGPARTGKTTAITQLGKTIEVIHQRRHPRSGDDIPVIYITVPPAATPKMIAIEFARFLGLPVSRQANITASSNRSVGCAWTRT